MGLAPVWAMLIARLGGPRLARSLTARCTAFEAADRHVGLEWRQIRFYLSPARFLREAGQWVLRIPANAKLAELWTFYAPDLHSPEGHTVAA